MSRSIRFMFAAMMIAILAIVPASWLPKSEDPILQADGDPPTEKAKGSEWLPRLADAYFQAQIRGQPILVKIESSNSEATRRLNAELERPEAVVELKRWVLVSLDADTSPEAKAFEVESLPALRLVSATGHVFAGREGVARGDELATWLRQNYDGVKAPPPALGTTEALNADSIDKLVAALDSRDPVIREMSSRRLLAVPTLAAKPVSESLQRGSLQARIAAIDLLDQWGGPVAGLDPWQPKTLTPDRLMSLTEWAAGDGPKPTPPDRALSNVERDQLRDEMTRLATVPGSEAIAIRERLVRYGGAAKEMVLGEILNATSDVSRERLTSLRYRLVANDALVLRWPGGLERLAATQAGVRHDAVKELARIAVATEEPLLLELFADADPFVRELSLRTLQAVSGKSSAGAIAKLLDDKDPNVRAAVLKQIAESPSSKLVGKVGEYLTKEKDLDLVVHAVKALRAARGVEALEHLRPLYKHESWRVRAEAVESAGEILSNLKQSSNDTSWDKEYKLIRDLLTDADGFVVGRAVGVLRRVAKADDFDALAKAADRHPELTSAVIQALDYRSEHRVAALPHLRRFCEHAQPSVRADAVWAVCTSFGNSLPPELLKALKDDDTLVRQTAAGAIFRELGSRRSDRDRDSDVVALEPEEPGALAEKMTKLFADTIPTLEGMLTAKEAKEQLSAARALIALGREKSALPILTATAAKNISLVSYAAQALSWLAAEARNDLCRQLIALKPDAEQVDDVIDELSSVKDPKGSDFLWELSTRDDLPMSAATQLSLTMQRQLTGGITRFSGEKTPAQIKLSESAVAKAKSGPILQRLTAILLLAEVNRDRASEPAAALAAAPDAAAVRRDAVLIAMVTAPDAEAEKMAIEAAKDPDGMVRSQAVQFLCFGTTNSFKLPTTGTWLRLESRYESYSGLRSNYVEFVPRVPRSLDLETARKLLRDPNPTTSAGAAYLLAVLGDPSGLTTLTRYWRESPRSEWMKLLAMAIASLEDDANVHILEEIYQQMNPEFEIGRHNSEIRSLYWIIRPMEGPNALRLRKRMRAEVGMQTIGTPG